jgi:hypothetical protein
MALEILTRNPELPPAEILRMAVADARRPQASFASSDLATGRRPHPAYANDLDPPAPFAELLRRVYAPDLDPHELLLIAAARHGLADELQQRLEMVRVHWERRVIQAFHDQYGLVAPHPTAPHPARQVAPGSSGR